MTGPRANEAMIIVGRKHTGKSTLANQIVTSFARSNPDKRALVINVNASPAYEKHPTITYAGLRQWKKGVYQFYDSDHTKMFDYLFKVFDPRFRKFDGIIAMEDCTKYIDPNPGKQMKAFLVDHRMWNADLLFTFHSLGSVPPFFWKMTSRLLLLKTQDVPDTSMARRIPNWKDVGAAFERVREHKDNYYHELVSTLI